MNVIEGILKRRSIRRFTDKPIEKGDITTLLRAAMMAPTARNCQEWEFIVVQDKNTLHKITTVHPYAQMLKEAACAIMVCGNTKKEHAPGYWMADCGAATQNILLAATELGIGSVWLGVYPNEERMNALSKMFVLPDYVKPLNVIALGYPDEQKPDIDRFDPEKIHLEKW